MCFDSYSVSALLVFFARHPLSSTLAAAGAFHPSIFTGTATVFSSLFTAARIHYRDISVTETNCLLWKTDVDDGTISISSTSTSTLISWPISSIFAGNRLISLALCERVRPTAEMKTTAVVRKVLCLGGILQCKKRSE